MEHAREKECGKVEAPWFIKAPFWALCFVLDVVYDGRWVDHVGARPVGGLVAGPAADVLPQMCQVLLCWCQLQR